MNIQEIQTVVDAIVPTIREYMEKSAASIHAVAGEIREENRALKAEILQLRSTPVASVAEVREGVPGKDGTNGRGIAAASIRNGVLFLRMTDDTEQEVGSVAGPPGKDAEGLPGKDGTQGERGERGADSVIPGPPGEKGERGADGIASREELESIVEARFADIQVRTFADAYQGVWADGLHTRGQFVTWGGSLWLSLVDTGNKPGENGDWRLVVKKGADAKR